jgi:hypothetical protein
MAIGTVGRSKTSSDVVASSVSTGPASSVDSREDLLAGFRWTSQRVLVVVGALIALDALVGWLYLGSYFSYFRVPLEALGLSGGEVLAQGARILLLRLA